MSAFYSEFDPKAAAWLRELIKRGLIADGVVDERDLWDVRPDELRRFTQVHLCAGIGVWSYVLRRAGWPDNRPCWTASFPCQPFSAAGQGRGFADERHLWPAGFHLIEQCRPDVIFGEQVASKDGLAWLDLIQADMEAARYAVGALDTCAAGFGAPHIRQRLYWVADANSRQCDRVTDGEGRQRNGQEARRLEGDGFLAPSIGPRRLGDDDEGLEGQWGGYPAARGRFGSLRPIATASEPRGLAHDDDDRFASGRSLRPIRAERDIEHGGTASGVGHTECVSSGRDARTGVEAQGGPALRSVGDNVGASGAARRTGPVNGVWRAADWLFCRDGKWRPVEPGAFPLAHGAAARVGRLRGYGNAVNVAQAQGFIEAYLDTLDDVRSDFFS